MTLPDESSTEQLLYLSLEFGVLRRAQSIVGEIWEGGTGYEIYEMPNSSVRRESVRRVDGKDAVIFGEKGRIAVRVGRRRFGPHLNRPYRIVTLDSFEELAGRHEAEKLEGGGGFYPPGIVSA